MKTDSHDRCFAKRHRQWLICALLVVVAIRLLTLGGYPLTDNTEARYAEVAREMVSSGNWVTLQLHGNNFWAKPPLSIWATAGTMRLFGVNEFGSRISHFLLSLLSLGLVYFIAAKQHNKDRALLAVFILFSSVLFFVSSGAVMTDASLNFGTTLSMVSFWQAVTSDKGRKHLLWGYLFFLGLVISLLAKGPVGLVLTFMPIFLWALWKRQWKTIIVGLPWIGGVILMIVLALPWFLAAEKHSPGFLEYYILGEHWKRFTQPGWTGDLYGSAHSHPRGTIWLYWLLAFLPWSLVGVVNLINNIKMHRSITHLYRNTQKWTAYLLVWAVSPMIFFSLAGNILWTYVLPGLPAFALLLADRLNEAFLFKNKEVRGKRRSLLTWIVAGLSIPLVFGLLVLFFPSSANEKSQKILVSHYSEFRPDSSSKLIYLSDRPYSAEFYTNGTAVKIDDLVELRDLASDTVKDCFAVKKRMVSELEATITKNMTQIGTFDDFSLLCEKKISTTVSLYDESSKAPAY